MDGDKQTIVDRTGKRYKMLDLDKEH